MAWERLTNGSFPVVLSWGENCWILFFWKISLLLCTSDSNNSHWKLQFKISWETKFIKKAQTFVTVTLSKGTFSYPHHTNEEKQTRDFFGQRVQELIFQVLKNIDDFTLTTLTNFETFPSWKAKRKDQNVWMQTTWSLFLPVRLQDVSWFEQPGHQTGILLQKQIYFEQNGRQLPLHSDAIVSESQGKHIHP